MSIGRATIQFRQHPQQRARLRNMADQMRRARVSGDAYGKPVIAFVISPEDRELLADALYTMAEAVVDD